jgi:hypothetical protein
MAIDNINSLINALGNNSSRIILDKGSLASQTAGSFCSLWRSTGQPGQGAIPTTPSTCNNDTLGTINFNQQVSPSTSYGAYLEVATSNAAMTLELHDRLAHMGGLVGNITTAQNVNLDLETLLSTDNLEQRIGSADYGDVQWWMEWYVNTGATATVATINVTYNDGSIGNLTTQSLAATRAAGHMISLNALVPAAASGKFIRKVNTVQLSVTSGTAGNFGFTATRIRMTLSSPIANYKSIADWAQLGLPEIYNSSAIFPIVLTSTTSSGTIRGGGKIIHG